MNLIILGTSTYINICYIIIYLRHLQTYWNEIMFDYQILSYISFTYLETSGWDGHGTSSLWARHMGSATSSASAHRRKCFMAETWNRWFLQAANAGRRLMCWCVNWMDLGPQFISLSFPELWNVSRIDARKCLLCKEDVGVKLQVK